MGSNRPPWLTKLIAWALSLPSVFFPRAADGFTPVVILILLILLFVSFSNSVFSNVNLSTSVSIGLKLSSILFERLEVMV